MEKIERILIINDRHYDKDRAEKEGEKDWRELLVAELNKLGFLATLFESNKATPEEVANKDPDLILCELGGEKIASDIRMALFEDERTKNIPFVIMSCMKEETAFLKTALDILERKTGTRPVFLKKTNNPYLFSLRVRELVHHLENTPPSPTTDGPGLAT